MHYAVVLFLFSSVLWSIEFDPLGTIVPDKAISVSPSGSEFESFTINYLVPISKDKYYAVLLHSSHKMNAWKRDEVEKQKRDGKQVINVEKAISSISNTIVPAFIRKDGKILYMGAESDEFQAGAGQMRKGFEIQAEPACPYAIFDETTNKIYCYDYNLHLKSAMEIPLDEAKDCLLGYDGKGYGFWVFGSKSEKKVEKVGNTAGFDSRTPVVQSKIIGKIYDLNTKRWIDFPASKKMILDAVTRKARTPNGEKAQLSIKNMEIYPIQSDIFNGSIEAIVAVGESGTASDSRFFLNGRRHFSRITIDASGIVKAVSMQLWHEFEDRRDIQWDTDKGILSLPSFFLPFRYLIYPLGKGLMVYYDAAISFPDADNQYETVTMKSIQHIFHFSDSNSIPEFYDFGDFYESMQEKASTSENLVITVGLSQRLSKDEFLFSALCVDRETNAQKNCKVRAEFVP
jgi:hypothetical protein